jgi:antitoxin component of MazEF toxin-antitoxin module
MIPLTVTVEEKDGELGFPLPDDVVKKLNLKIGDKVELFFPRKNGKG